MKAKQAIAVILLTFVAGLSAACSGGGEATPTRTPKALAENLNSTQTPWIIYVPVTTTPEPFTITPLPTVTSSNPTPKPTRTRAPLPAATKAPALPTAIPQTSTPVPTPVPACDQVYQVTTLLFPENPSLKTTSKTHNSNRTLQFRFQPVVGFPMDTKIGYMVQIKSFRGNTGNVVNSDAIFISHNGYLAVSHGNGDFFLDGNRTYTLTLGENSNATWNVTVLRTTGGFDDHNFAALGDVTFCGPPSPSSTIMLQVIE